MNNRKYIEAIKAVMIAEVNKSPRMGRIILGSEYKSYIRIIDDKAMSDQAKLDQLQIIANGIVGGKGIIHELLSEINTNVPYEKSSLKAYLDKNNLSIESPAASPTSSPRAGTQPEVKPEPVKITRPRQEIPVAPQKREEVAAGVLQAIDQFIQFELNKPIKGEHKQKLVNELEPYCKFLSEHKETLKSGRYNPDGSEGTLNQLKTIAEKTKSNLTQVHTFIQKINMKHEIADPRITKREVELMTTPKSQEKSVEPVITPPTPKKG